jgi:hypothetical protein
MKMMNKRKMRRVMEMLTWMRVSTRTSSKHFRKRTLVLICQVLEGHEEVQELPLSSRKYRRKSDIEFN